MILSLTGNVRSFELLGPSVLSVVSSLCVAYKNFVSRLLLFFYFDGALVHLYRDFSFNKKCVVFWTCWTKYCLFFQSLCVAKKNLASGFFFLNFGGGWVHLINILTLTRNVMLFCRFICVIAVEDEGLLCNSVFRVFFYISRNFLNYKASFRFIFNLLFLSFFFSVFGVVMIWN